MKQLLNTYFKLSILLAFMSFLLLQNTLAQKIGIISDPQNVYLDQDFIITITVPFQRKIKVGNFPEISDFSKKETRFDRQDSLIVIYQHYRPRKTGNFHLDPFKVYINNEFLVYDKTTHINVFKISGISQTKKEDDNKDFEQELIQSKLYITTNKTEVYKNETFEAKLYLEINSEGDPEFNFIDLQQQLNILTQKIIPENGLHQFQNFGIISIGTTNKESKTRTFLLANLLIAAGTAETITIPSLQFSFLTYDKKRSKELIQRQDNIITLRSAPYKIQIKDLPKEYSHLSPGNFTLQETTSKNHITVNQSFSYQFIVLSASQNLFYSNPIINPLKSAIVIPDTKPKSNSNKNQYFTYQIVPTQTGRLELKNLFYWPFFNTRTNSPDTLKPNKVVQVYGKSSQNTVSYQDSPFYKEIDSENAILRPIRKDNMLNLFTNLVILFMFAVTAILIIRK